MVRVLRLPNVPEVLEVGARRGLHQLYCSTSTSSCSARIIGSDVRTP